MLSCCERASRPAERMCLAAIDLGLADRGVARAIGGSTAGRARKRPALSVQARDVLVKRFIIARMTMLSFRVSDEDAAEVQHWAVALGIDRSEILRDALHRHLVVLKGEADAESWQHQPATDAERSLEAIADWRPAEDWSDWTDAEE